MPGTQWSYRGGLVYEKELLPVGKITKWVSDDLQPVAIDVTREFLDNTVKQFELFRTRGVRVPLFKTHREDPDNDRGTVQDVLVKPNDKGVDSLFVRVQFNDAAARDQGIHNDVSAMCPPRFVDGRGNRYDYPLRHVALTSKPVVPGLKPFEPVILSFDTDSGLLLAEGDNMDPEKWAELLGLVGVSPEGEPDQQLIAVIAAVQALKGAGQAPPAGGGAPPVALSFPPIVVAQMRKSRESQIDGLLDRRVLTPARAEEFKTLYCTDESCTTDLQLSADDEKSVSEFDRAVDMATKFASDRPLLASGRTTMKLSHEDKAKNPLLADAQRRADKAAAKK